MLGFSPVPAFPQYTGPYSVGTADIEVPLKELVPTQPSPDSDVTTLSARIFYPCQPPDKAGTKAYWYPNPQSEYFASYLRFLGASTRFASFISAIPRLLYYIALPAHQNASILPAPTSTARWPTMIFSHGLGGTRNMYSHICGSLASHGVVVIAPEHRDGSAPVAFVRDEHGNIAHTVHYQTIAHENTSSTQLARNSQLKQRLWEMGESYSLAVKLDKGVIFSNHAMTSKERAAAPDLNLSMFRNMLNVHEPASVHLAGHSFGAVTALQFLKSVFYNAADAPATYKPLFDPPRDSAVVRQFTSRTSLTLLDCWMLPTQDPATTWLHDQPLPCYAEDGPGGRVILAVLSEGFYRWSGNWKEQRKALSPDPSQDPKKWASDRLSDYTSPRIFYPSKSAHLSQSDFGVLFPWLAKKAFKAEDPQRTITLNVRAILESWRNNGAEVSDTCQRDMEVIEETLAADARNESKPAVSRRSSDETLTEDKFSFNQDNSIFLRDGSVRGWIALGLGDEDPASGDEAKGGKPVKKDAGRILKERAQKGVA